MKMSKNGMGKFLTGVAVGVGLGILFAPKKGSETRQDLKNKMDDLIKKAKDLDKEDVKLAIEEKVNKIRESLADLNKEKVLTIAKKKARQIQDMAQELVDYVVSKGTPVVEKAADAVRKQAIATTKNVLDKLEKADKKNGWLYEIKIKT